MMAYYNENDGLYYANEEFTTLFTGLDQTSYIYYLNGVQTTLNMHGFGTWNGNFYVEGDINNSYTGWHWSDDSNTFYVNSEATTLDTTGFGTWNGNFYVDGQINNSYTGLNSMSTAYYVNSEETTLDLEGFGTWNGNFYVYGQINNSYTGPDGWNSVYYVNSEATTLDSGGSGFWSDKAYINGTEQPTGWNGYFYYIDNVETTLDTFGYGFWDGKAYSEGVEQPTGWTGYFYYINNVQTTLGDNGDGEWNGQTYVNGVVQGGGDGGGGGGGGSVDLESGLQAFYKLDDTSDSSGNGNTLTNNNNVSFASGKIGNAAVFDGSNYLDVNMASLPQGAQNRTISFWFNSTKTDPQVPLYYGTPTAGELVLFYVDSQSVIVSPYGDGVSSGEIVNDGNWHHLLFKTNNETWMLYIDGELKDSQYRSTSTNGTTLTIGYGSDGNTEGSVDAIGIWDRALNSAEIAALYNSGTGYEIGSAPVAAFVKIQGNAKFYGNVKFVS